MSQALQEKYAPNLACFGCGPANPKGLHVRTIPADNKCVCSWTAKPEHEAYPGILSGGVIGTLLDCHSNWTAAWHIMQSTKASVPPCTVTAEFTVKMRKPTPTTKGPIELNSWIVEDKGDRVWVEGSLTVAGDLCVSYRGLHVAVKEGHPAFHRW